MPLVPSVPSVTPEPAPSSPVIGQYELLTRLGSGGMGMVFKARHTGLKRTVALKILAPHYSHHPEAVSRFRVEMEALGRLTHPHIARATDAGEAGGFYYLAMEFVDGTDLARVLNHHGRLGVADACEVIRQAADALAYIHAHGMLHRDIKPSNLLLGRDGSVRVLDLGLARLRQRAEDDQLTVTGAVMGTADFIAPEQARGSRDVDIRADVYSLGCTLFALLTGAPPFATPEFESVYKKFKAHNETPPPSARALAPDVPPALEWVVAGMLEKDPAGRPQTPEDVVRGLAPFCAGSDLGRLVSQAPALSEGAVTMVGGLPPLPDLPLETRSHLPQPATVTLPTPRPGAFPTTLSLGPPARRRRWGRSVAPGIVLAVLAVVIWPRGEQGDPPDSRPDPPPPDRVFKPGEWTEMLDRPPVKRIWPDGDDRSRIDYDAREHLARLDCADLGVLDLGDVAARAYDVEAVLYQTGWPAGRVGVFVRGHEPYGRSAVGRMAAFARDPYAPQYRWRADTLFLDTLNVWHPDASNQVKLVRGRMGTYQSGSKSVNGGFSYQVDHPYTREVTLAFTVTDRDLEQVTWNGQAAQPPRNRPPMPLRSAAGGVGVYVQNSSAQFRSFRVRPHAPE